MFFSYNGELLASGSADHDIIVWDTFARTAMFRLIGHTTPIIGLDFIYRKLGPDSHGQTVLDIAKPSHLISASHDGELRLWDFTSQRCLQVVTARTTKGGIHSFLLTPDQNHLILGGRGLELFSLKDRGLVEDDLVDESSEYILAYAGEIPRDSTKRINQLIFFVPNRRTTERALPNGVVLSTDLTRGYVPAEDKSFILASTGTRRIEVILRLDPIQQRRRLVRTLIRKIEKLKNRSKKIKVGNNVDVELQGLLGNDWVFEEDGSKACNEIDHALALLRQQISEAKKKSNSKKRPRGSMEANPVLIYKMAPQVIDSPKHKLLHMAATPTDGTLLFSTSSNLIQELKIDMDTLISTMAIHGIHDSLVSPAVNMSISSNDRILMAICKTQVSIWDLKSRKCTIRLEAEDGHSFNAGFFLPGDDYVLVGNALGFVLIYHLPTLTLVNKIQCHDGPIIDIHSMPNRSGFVTVGADKLLKTHKFRLLENTNLVNVDGIISFDTLQERELIDKPLCVRCSPDGRFIATGLNDNTVTVTFLDSLKIHLTLFGHTLPVTTIAWTSDGQRLASGSMDRHMKIWDPEFGNIIKSLQNGRRGHITTILFCNMTHYLVCANSQGSIQLWDSDIGERITTLEGSLAAVTCLASTQDTEVIAAANSDGSIQLWARTEEQIFLNEEREREANAKILKDAAKSGPLPTAAARDVISADRPTKPVIETVRNTEKLIDIIDQAIEEQNSLLGYKMAVDDWDKKGRNGSPPPPPTPKIELMGKSPRQHVLAALNSLTTEIVNEVLLALPLKYSITVSNQALHFLFKSGLDSRIHCRRDGGLQ